MTRLYVLRFSHPSIAARLMLEHARVEHELVELPMGLHRVLLKRRHGFPGITVPALILDDRKVQGSLAISRAIEARGPAGVLFPVDPQARARVEEAERWGEAELQPIPRRLFRWALARDPGLRRRAARATGLPGLAGAVLKPLARRIARESGADDAAVRRDLELLPAHLDRVERWIAEGTIGGADRNAADFQIGTALAAMLAMEDLRPFVEARRSAELARRILPEYPGRLPAVVPPGWSPGSRDGAAIVP